MVCSNKCFGSYLHLCKSFLLTVFIGFYATEWCTEFMRNRCEVFDYSPGRCELFQCRFAFAYYQLISDPPIKNFFEGKSFGEMSVLYNRRKLSFMVLQCGL